MGSIPELFTCEALGICEVVFVIRLVFIIVIILAVGISFMLFRKNKSRSRQETCPECGTALIEHLRPRGDAGDAQIFITRTRYEHMYICPLCNFKKTR